MQALRAIHLEEIIDAVREYQPDADVDRILGAYAFASAAHKGQVRLSGEPYMNHPMQVALILTKMKMDPASVAAGLLHDTLEDTEADPAQIRSLFGEEVLRLVEGLTKLSRLTFASKEESQAENVRKMILAMSNDLRVVLIKLADRLHNMRTLDFLPPQKQKFISQETMDIYAPLANRLGLHWLKVELENIAFKYLLPFEYKRIEGLMKERQDELDKFINSLCAQTRELMLKEKILGQVSWRFKHYYGIYRKMTEQNLDFDQIYDLIGVRIITNSLLDCYKVLGLVHTKWKPIPGKFKDYIALPKENMYQSIHTTVLTHTGRRVEFQIRSSQMHRNSEDGVAAHFRYKEGKRPPTKDDENFIWVKRLLDLGLNVDSSEEFIDNLKMDLFPNEVYVFTPKQEVKAFPAGATPLDFAYEIHTQLGNHFLGALVNGKPAPPDYQLRNGDVVEVLTSNEQHPVRDWLKIAVTSHGRAKIKSYLRGAQKVESLRLGNEIVENELRRHGLDPAMYWAKDAMETAALSLGFKNAEVMLDRVGISSLSAYSVLHKLLPAEKWREVENRRKNYIASVTENLGVRVGDIHDMLIRFAGCCNPVPGDPILGYISAGHGLVIHAKSCPSLKSLEADPERLLEARWETAAKKQMRPVRILIKSLNRPGILARVSAAIAGCEANIASATVAATNPMEGDLDLTVEIEDLNHLQRVLEAVRGLDGIRSVERIMDARRADRR